LSFRRINAIVLTILLLPVFLLAQSSQKPLTNADVVEMVRGGLAETTVILSIQNSTTNFDTSPRALIELKKNGVRQKEMDAMLSAANKVAAPAPADAPAPAPSRASGLPDGKALMARVVNAAGGEKAIREVKATRVTSSRVVNVPGLNATIEVVQTVVYPDRVHVALKSPQFTSVTVYRPDGPFLLVNGKPQNFPETAQQEMVRSMKLGLINVAQHADDPKFTFTVNGSEKIGDTETVILEIGTEGGQTRWNVDPESGRILRATRVVVGAGGATALNRFEYSDWRTNNGVTYPFKILQNGIPYEEIRSYEVNPSIPDGLFDKPGAAVASPGASDAPATVSRSASTPSSPGGTLPTEAGINSGWKQALFRDVRKQYENTSVLVLGDPSGIRVLGHMNDWSLAGEKKGRYVAQAKYLEFKYLGQTAKVIAVQLEHNMIQEAHRLGPSDDDVLDPYFSLVVRFDDGTTAMSTTYPIMAKKLALPAEDAARHEAAMRAGIALMLGNTVYAISYSHFYYPDLKMIDAVEVVQSGYATQSVDQIRDVPLLQPLRVTKAGFLKAADAALLTLTLPDGRSVLSIVTCDGKDGSCYGNYGSELFGEIPGKLTPDEVEAIRKKTFFHGMSKEALYMSIGLPQTENDYGKGGYQLVYANGKVLIYTDQDGKVRDSQSFD
jgi:hypothetical protein